MTVQTPASLVTITWQGREVAIEYRWVNEAARHAARPLMVFLHEGLGSVAMWQSREGEWPEQVCAATGRAGWVYSRPGYGQSDPISLAVTDHDGQMQIQWNHSSSTITRATAGALEITDGQQKQQLALTPAELAAGSRALPRCR